MKNISDQDTKELFENRRIIILLELFIVVFFAVLIALAIKTSSEQKVKLKEEANSNKITIDEASEIINNWIFNKIDNGTMDDSKYGSVSSFTVSSLKEYGSNVIFNEKKSLCYEFVIKYNCVNEASQGKCLFIGEDDLINRSENEYILSGALVTQQNDYYFVSTSCDNIKKEA